MVSVIQALILSIVQGITEWLPISSSGHLAIFQNIFGFQNLPFDVFLHFASILAVFVIFWKDIVKLFNFKDRKNLKYLGLLAVALVPAAIVGLLFKSQIASFFSSELYLGIFFMASGGIVYSTKFAKPRPEKEKPSWLDSIFIGLMQALAILPGVSRSGSTISGGMFRGLKKEEAVKFSFLLAVPVILGASILEAKDLVLQNMSYVLLLASFVVTFLVSLIAIKILLRIIKGDRFYLFGLYNFFVGLIIFCWSIWR